MRAAITDEGIALLARMREGRSARLGALPETLEERDRAAVASALTAFDRLLDDAEVPA